MLGVIMPRLFHLIFYYRPGLVGLELLQNICEGRGCHVNILTKKDRNIFQNEKLSQTPKNSIIKVIKLEQNIKLNN